MPVIAFIVSLLGMIHSGAQPLRVHPDNPRIFEYKGQPTVLKTFAEHYGSVINPDFNYTPYLNTLQQEGMNLTRVILVGFHANEEDPNDTISPRLDRFLQPWPRKPSAGNALDGFGKWDLSVWNEAYFTRLRAFVAACATRGVMVELTLFNTFYTEDQWELSPLNPLNNVQGIGPSTGVNSRYDSMRPVNAALYAAQQAVVRRIVRDVNPYDNVYFEIQNEPFWNQPGIQDAAEVTFHNTMLGAIRNEESTLPKRHLVAHNFPQQVNSLVNDYDIINCHYPFAVPSTTIVGGENLLKDFYTRNRPLSLDETITAGPIESRLESWLFLLGGGAIYNGLDQGSAVYSISTPAGTGAPGPAIRANLRNLGGYYQSLDIIGLRRDLSWLAGGAHPSSRRQGMSKPGQQYVMYFYHGSFSAPYQTVFSPIDASNHTANLRVNLPNGSYRAVWTRPSDMTTLRTETFNHTGGEFQLQPVTYQEDVVLRIDRTGAGDLTAPPPPTGFVATLNAQSNIMLNWSAPSAADLAQYRIRRSSGTGTPNFSGTPIATVAAGTSSFIDDTATPGQEQRYVITALDDQGNESRFSGVALAVAPINLAPPVAAAGADQILFDVDHNQTENVTFNGAASVPGDRPIVSYSWRAAGVQIGSGVNPTLSLPTGIHDIQLVVTDNVGLTGSDVVRISLSNMEFHNGSFENSSSGPFPPGVHSTLASGLAGWAITSESNPLTSNVDHPATHGNTVLVFGGLNKPGGSSITQTFPTVPGRIYLVDFDMGVIAYNTTSLQRLTAQVQGDSLQPLLTFQQLGDVSPANNGKLVWTNPKISFSFVADSVVSSLTLRDASTATIGLDLVLDNVKVRAQADRTLSLATQPAAAVPLTISPVDLDGLSGGMTPFSRNFGNGTIVTISAPLVSGGQGFRRWLSNGVNLGNANPITLTLTDDESLVAVYENGPPVILSQPQSVQVATGESVVFNVSAAGDGTLSYQWRFNQSDISGATGGSFSIPNVTGLLAGTYDVVVTSNGGQTISQAATLSVPLPLFTNGSFENGLEGWDLQGNAFVLGVFPGYEASHGTQLIVFNGGNTAPNGWISHTFATVPGVSYQIRYDARIVAFKSDQQILRLEVNGNSLLREQNLVFTGSNLGPVPWQAYSESFVADSTSTTLTFRDLSTKTDSVDLLLDNIRILAQSPIEFAQPEPPGALPQSAQTAEDSSVAITLTGTGGNGGSPAFSISVNPAHGTLSGDAPNLTYTPNADFHGTDTFRFVMSVGSDTSPEATVTIAVNPVNDAPVANSQALESDEDIPLIIALTGSDVDGDSLVYSITEGPAHGVLNGNPPFLVYTPASGYSGPDTITFTASDGIAPPVAAVITLAIAATTPPPLPDMRVERITEGCRIFLNAHAAGTYRIEWSDDLDVWHEVTEQTLTEAGEIHIDDTTANDERRFYRAASRR